MPYVALITGASSGIGEATARRRAREPDVQLILVARREERLLALAEEVDTARTFVFPADLTDPGKPLQIAEFIERQYGALNLLVNNAGARWSTDFADGGWANVERHMRVNFEAPVRLVEALLPLMRRTADAAGSVDGGQTAVTSFAGRPLKAPVAIVNVTSTSARISRLGTGCLQRQQERARGLERLAVPGGAPPRRARRKRAPGLHLDGRLSSGGTARQSAAALGRLRRRARRRGDHRSRSGWRGTKSTCRVTTGSGHCCG